MSEKETTEEIAPAAEVDAIEATRARVEPYVAAAAEAGMNFRVINGLMVRIGENLDIDIDAIGSQTYRAKDDDGVSDDAFYDDFMRACWLLCEDEEALLDAEEGGPKSVKRAFRRWQLKTLKTPAIEHLAMKAFIARWFEWRLESAEALTGEPIPE